MSDSSPGDPFSPNPPLDPFFDGSQTDTSVANLRVDSILVPFDFTQLAPGETPQIEVDFELEVATRLDITNNNDLGTFEALFNADFSNTATLLNVTVLDGALQPIENAFVVDSSTGQSIVASSVPEPSSMVVLMLLGCAGSFRRTRRVPHAH